MPFSEEQIIFIRDNCGSMSPADLAKELNAGCAAVRKAIKDLGLHSPRSGGPFGKKNTEILIAMGKAGKTPVEISDATGRSVEAVQKKARELGVLLNGTPRHWTAADKNILKRYWGRVALGTIASELKRSKSALIAQARKMHLPPCYLQSEDIPLAEFCRDTGFSRFRIMDTLAPKYGFPVKTMKPGKSRVYHYVDIDLILDWLEQHQELYSAAGIPLFYFGDDPDWLVKKRRHDTLSDKPVMDGRFTAEKWTQDDVNKLRDMLKMGLSHEAIADRLGRSVGAVKHKLQREGLSYTAPQFWKGSEFKAIKNGARSKSDTELAKELGRPVKSVATHRLTMGISRREMNDENRSKAYDYIAENWRSQSDKEMAEALGYSERSVREFRTKLGLLRGKNQFG